MGIGLVDMDSKNCIMLRGHQTPSQKELNLTNRIFKASGYRPNRTLISKVFKDLVGLQRKAA